MNQATKTPVVSLSIKAAPIDKRCRYWAKVIRRGAPLPPPAAVSGANDIPGEYLRQGVVVELFPGDVILEGEAEHRRKQRGWNYLLRECVDVDGVAKMRNHSLADADTRPVVRAAGERDLLLGSGVPAAMVRRLHAMRLQGAELPGIGKPYAAD